MMMIISMNIQTRRLNITNFLPNHKKDFINFFINHENTKYLFLEDHLKTETGAGELFDYVISSYNTENHIHSYAIVDKNNKFLGSCGFSPFNDSYECYYSIDEKHCGKGYATEALTSLINHCLQKLNFDELIANIIPENIASEKVAINAGMRYIKNSINEESGKAIKVYKIKK